MKEDFQTDYYAGAGREKKPQEELPIEEQPKEEKVVKKKPIYKKWWFWVIIVCFAIAVVDNVTETENAGDVTQAEIADKSWRDNLSPKLVAEIESAFTEIGENPDNIVSVEYVDIHTSGYVFEQKCYKVEFSWSLGKPGYKHSRYYRIVTQNYYDGEPEKQQYPDEFLCTIKYWAGDDGHGTNVNQWAWTGNGEKQ